MATFTVVLELAGKTATGIKVPQEIVDGFAAGKRFPVVVTIKTYSYRTTVAVMDGDFYIPVSAEHRELAGITAGDELIVEIVLDTQPREVVIPEDFSRALEMSDSVDAFMALAFSHRKEYVRWIEEAKKPETRQSRIEKAVEMIRAGKTRT
jgi:hypothetical protein